MDVEAKRTDRYDTPKGGRRMLRRAIDIVIDEAIASVQAANCKLQRAWELGREHPNLAEKGNAANLRVKICSRSSQWVFGLWSPTIDLRLVGCTSPCAQCLTKHQIHL